MQRHVKYSGRDYTNWTYKRVGFTTERRISETLLYINLKTYKSLAIVSWFTSHVIWCVFDKDTAPIHITALSPPTSLTLYPIYTPPPKSVGYISLILAESRQWAGQASSRPPNWQRSAPRNSNRKIIHRKPFFSPLKMLAAGKRRRRIDVASG